MIIMFKKLNRIKKFQITFRLSIVIITKMKSLFNKIISSEIILEFALLMIKAFSKVTHRKFKAVIIYKNKRILTIFVVNY